MKSSQFALAVIASAALLLSAAPALAHARLMHSNPADKAVLKMAPATISLTFDDRLVPAFSKFTVTMPEHGMDVPVKTTVSTDGKTISGHPKGLTKGVYKIAWFAASTDGHKTHGEIGFKVD